ncbi:hypothetical protein [Leptolyngbya sp. 7M]|uniref:hypothetical protein n=1 Tax=Leptolyngbya sp. 7M TaxID=2812896 RepID=UPI001B8B794B|nr:hypothetical protein [Leptolyngbya sp. 7M]QYO64865.1 hypothetical protein JVX88_35790 [Leptolyngbya sp. 7M]
MKEAIFIFAVIAVLIALTAFRYRRQLIAGFEIWRTLRQMQQQIRSKHSPDGSPAMPNEHFRRKGNDEMLVNCSKCGKWISEATAIRFDQNVFFCSAKYIKDLFIFRVNQGIHVVPYSLDYGSGKFSDEHVNIFPIVSGSIRGYFANSSYLVSMMPTYQEYKTPSEVETSEGVMKKLHPTMT